MEAALAHTGAFQKDLLKVTARDYYEVMKTVEIESAIDTLEMVQSGG